MRQGKMNKKNYSLTDWGFSRKSPKAYPLYKKIGFGWRVMNAWREKQ
jgi:hypothetical protein